MAEQIRAVDYYYVTCSNKPGEGARALAVFRDAGVNLLAVHGFPQSRRAQIDLVPEDATALRKAARKAKLNLSPKKKAFLITGDDQHGVVANLLEKLAQAKVNITAVTALCADKGQFSAILWVKPRDQRQASKVLGV